MRWKGRWFISICVSVLCREADTSRRRKGKFASQRVYIGNTKALYNIFRGNDSPPSVVGRTKIDGVYREAASRYSEIALGSLKILLRSENDITAFSAN
jgi:hypothetical protein